MSSVRPTASGPEPGERIVVAMSGGVDSSVAAAMLVREGFDVVGLSLRLSGEHRRAESKGCCSIEDFRDAERVAARLGIAHYTFDMREDFQTKVIDPFVREYLAGRTPSPCILCNREIKFGQLRSRAAELGARFVATGHYARIHRDGDRFRLLRGSDPAKDQSYFLFEMGQAELAGTLFPVGDLDKPAVRQMAVELGLATADKAESQEICFVPDGRYAEVVERQANAHPETLPQPAGGDIVDGDGNVLGRHEGIHRYTVGQRRGLGIAAEAPRYVTALDARRGTVTVGPRPDLLRRGLIADGLLWTQHTPPGIGETLTARIRHRHAGAEARVIAYTDQEITLEFTNPLEAISPGQAVVFYRGEEVLGGAWIREGIPLTAEELAAAQAGQELRRSAGTQTAHVDRNQTAESTGRDGDKPEEYSGPATGDASCP